MPSIDKNNQQTHLDILRSIGEAQVSGKGIEVTKSGKVIVASFGTRVARAINEKIKGADWANQESLKTNKALAEKLNEAILRKSANFVNHDNYGTFKALLDRAGTQKDLPSSRLFHDAIKKLNLSTKDLDPSLIRYKKSELTIETGNLTPTSIFTGIKNSRAGKDIAPGSSTKADLIESHLKDLAASPAGIKPHEIGVQNRFLYDSLTDGGGEKLSQVLDKTKNYLYAIAIDSDGKPHVRIGYEGTVDGAKKIVGKRADLTGHPTLTNDLGEGKAVIGGELKYNRDKNGWEIDNNSGRYGAGNAELKKQLGLTSEDVLDYAASRFNNIGLQLVNINKLYD
jgi:hypothetical protein